MKNVTRLWRLEIAALVLLTVSSYAACGSDSGASPSSADAGDVDASSEDAGDEHTQPPLGVDAAVPVQDSGTVPIDAGPPANGPGGDPGTIFCGQSTCPIPASACCVYREQGDAGYTYTFACSGQDTCPVRDGGVPGVALRCSGSENCGVGKICCFSDQGTGSRADCQISCGGGIQMCNGRRPPAGCPGAQTCSNANDSSLGLPTTYGTCGDRPM